MKAKGFHRSLPFSRSVHVESKLSLTMGEAVLRAATTARSDGDSEDEPCDVGERIASPCGWSSGGYGRSRPFFLDARGRRFRHTSTLSAFKNARDTSYPGQDVDSHSARLPKRIRTMMSG